MKKIRMSFKASKIIFLFFGAALLTALVVGMPASSHAKKAAAGIVDLNTADEKTLETLPGVGSSTAKAIIAGRPYKSIDDLKRVKGMSDKKINAIKDMVTVGAAPAMAAPAAVPSAAAMTEKASSETKAATEKAQQTKTKLAPGQVVNINTASAEELDALPGIGKKKAQAIIDGRPYSKPEDIMKVKGIKQKTYDKIKDLITVR
jgi:competence protein ComEA